MLFYKKIYFFKFGKLSNIKINSGSLNRKVVGSQTLLPQPFLYSNQSYKLFHSKFCVIFFSFYCFFDLLCRAFFKGHMANSATICNQKYISYPSKNHTQKEVKRILKFDVLLLLFCNGASMIVP